MKERPILFSGPMVKAILDGRKTQTRRIIKPQPCLLGGEAAATPSSKLPCPYGRVGDRLRVKETFWTNGKKPTESDFVIYDLEHQEQRREVCKTREGELYSASFLGDFKRWPSIFLPKWASRITLEITNIRVERLQEISEEDAKAEGVEPARVLGCERGYKDYMLSIGGVSCARKSFETLWQSINGPDSWKSNPWVWVIEFRKINP